MTTLASIQTAMNHSSLYVVFECTLRTHSQCIGWLCVLLRPWVCASYIHIVYLSKKKNCCILFIFRNFARTVPLGTQCCFNFNMLSYNIVSTLLLCFSVYPRTFLSFLLQLCILRQDTAFYTILCRCCKVEKINILHVCFPGGRKRVYSQRKEFALRGADLFYRS